MGRTENPGRDKGLSARVKADTQIAAEVKALLARGDTSRACERFEALVQRQQRRATRIAYSYLRDPADVDEAVQDAFLKAFLHLPSFREDLLFELWFTRIVVNGCLDRLKARTRRRRWLVPTGAGESDWDVVERWSSSDPTPEARLLQQERRAKLRAAVERLPMRQREVVVLSQFEGHTTREVSKLLGLNEATVRVHLFRAIRSLRKALRGERWLAGGSPREREAS